MPVKTSLVEVEDTFIVNMQSMCTEVNLPSSDQLDITLSVSSLSYQAANSACIVSTHTHTHTHTEDPNYAAESAC